MRYLVLVLLLFITSVIYTKSIFIQYGKVIAKSGLTMRKTPSVDGERKYVIPFNTNVYIIDQSSSKEKIGDKEAHWYKVQCRRNNSFTDGWVFGGFLDIKETSIKEWDEDAKRGVDNNYNLNGKCMQECLFDYSENVCIKMINEMRNLNKTEMIISIKFLKLEKKLVDQLWRHKK
jgi:hypothetical protein